MCLMLSIDFGNTYTKVALRPGADGSSELLKDLSLKWDSLNSCIPTLAASLESGGATKWFFGTDVLKFREHTDGLTVYRNWKPRFFEDVDVSEPVSVLQRGQDARARLETPPPGIDPAAWTTIRGTLPAAEVELLWERLTVRPTMPTSSADGDLVYKEVALGFFRWLRRFIDATCMRRLNLPAAEIPARISLPSFGSVAKAELLLTEILSEAGWRLDERKPVLPEPLSNAIGTFSEGLNSTHSHGTRPNYSRMFQQTGLVERIREAALRNGPKSAWVLIIDLGGYTTDCAAVGLDFAEGLESSTGAMLDGKPSIAHESRPLGVTDLDRRVRQLLSEGKQRCFDQLLNDADQQRLENFHRDCYGPLGRYTILKTTTIGGTPTEKKAISEVVHQFANDVADDAEKFLEIQQHARIDDLILTGGGTLIPAVREAICKRMKRYGTRKVHMYAPDGPTHSTSTLMEHSLKYELVRGASAVGGSSVYFDFLSE